MSCILFNNFTGLYTWDASCLSVKNWEIVWSASHSLANSLFVMSYSMSIRDIDSLLFDLIYLFLYFACKSLWLLLKLRKVWRYHFHFWAHTIIGFISWYTQFPRFLCVIVWNFCHFLSWGIIAGYHNVINFFTLLLWNFNEECALESSKEHSILLFNYWSGTVLSNFN